MTSLAHFVEGRAARLPPGLALRWPGGRAGDNGSAVTVTLQRRRLLGLLAHGCLGDLADAYVRGELDIEGDLGHVMAVAGALAGDPVRGDGVLRRTVGHLRSLWRHRLSRNARQVRHHYDLSDEFYALWLDPLRVFSCAYFGSPDATLAQAQEDKLELVCRKLRLQPGQRFLDVGSGWGALLIWAAQHHGVEATGITLSRHQHAYVSRLIDESGLRGRVTVRLLDYRQLEAHESFDRIASIGMSEHVGRARLSRYFSTLRRLLRPGGLLLNHAIAAGGVDNDELGTGMGDFIEKYIFPGGELVHVSRAAEALARGGLELVDAENLRPHYARTLWAWSDRLEVQLERARALTSEASVRAYRLYLAGSAMSFERGWLSHYQLVATRPDGPVTVVREWAARSDHPFRRGLAAPVVAADA